MGDESVESEAAAAAPAQVTIDPRRSLAITDQPTLANFAFARVMNQIAATSGVSGVTGRSLFQQWWDTQNPKLGAGPGAHCDDTTDGAGNPTLNGYPYTCRGGAAEGSQASCDPFTAGSACAYIPVGLFMRFDLAPAGGANCGEYRIVFAKATGRTSATDRNLLIFEASVGNPTVQAGLGGCERFVRAWANLSLQPTLAARQVVLEQLYFTGYQSFTPIVHFNNFGENAAGLGQIRTNQFIQPATPRIWSLREFKLGKQCSGGTCQARVVPVTNKVNPFGPLFNPASSEANAPDFQSTFLDAVPELAATSVSGIGMNTNDRYNSGQSQANGTTENDYPANFGPGPSAFHTAVQNELSAIGSALTPTDIVQRAGAMSCAGCHRLNNNVAIGGGLTWPASLGFTHVSERDADLEVVAGSTRFRLSPALVDHFLPHRKKIVEDFLNGRPRPPMPPNQPIGGRVTH